MFVLQDSVYFVITCPVFLCDNEDGVFKPKHVGECKLYNSRLRLKCDGTRTETRFHLSAKRTSPFK